MRGLGLFKLKILGPRYYPIVFKDTLHFDDLKNILNSELVIKQKNGYFSYSDDPKVRPEDFLYLNVCNRWI